METGLPVWALDGRCDGGLEEASVSICSARVWTSHSRRFLKIQTALPRKCTLTTCAHTRFMVPKSICLTYWCPVSATRNQHKLSGDWLSYKSEIGLTGEGVGRATFLVEVLVESPFPFLASHGYLLPPICAPFSCLKPAAESLQNVWMLTLLPPSLMFKEPWQLYWALLDHLG